MRNFQRILCGVLPLLGAAFIGCGTTENVGTGQARIIVASQGSKPATLHVTATDDATAEVVLDKSIDLTEGTATVIELSLDAAEYTIHVDAVETADSSKVIGSADARADVAADQTKEIHLTAKDGGATGDGSVSVSVTTAPVIANIEVTLATSGVSTGADGEAKITVDASDPDGGEVMYFWSGLGLEGAVQGTSTLSISALAALTFAGSKSVHLVVQDSDGATTIADIDFTGSASCVLCGESETTVGGSTDAGQACVDVRAQCNADCSATLELDPTGIAAALACMTDCGLDLATCASN